MNGNMSFPLQRITAMSWVYSDKFEVIVSSERETAIVSLIILDNFLAKIGSGSGAISFHAWSQLFSV